MKASGIRAHRNNQKDYKLRERGKLKLKVIDYLRDHPCVDCGESDHVVLEFDHVGEKQSGVANMVNDVKKWDDILSEIEKCHVRCANCHKRKTAKQLGYWKQIDLM